KKEHNDGKKERKHEEKLERKAEKRRRHEADAVTAAQEKVEEVKYSTEIERPKGMFPSAPVLAPSGVSAPKKPEREAADKPVGEPAGEPLSHPPSGPYPTELPAKYGDDSIVAMVRDPYWIFAYWEITPKRLESVRRELGAGADGSKTTLRVYDITGLVFTGDNPNSYFDIEVSGGADNWYINTGWPNRSYCVDIGLLSPQGKFCTLARSNPVHTPRASASEVVDERWMSLEEEFERIYALSGGFQIGHGSLELRQMMEKQLQIHMASEAPASLFSMAAPAKERGFWLAVETELIVFGATDPAASVTIQGRPIKLRPDGTFSVRFALPDGGQVIPVTAQSPDGVEERTITPTVTRSTETREPVFK
ncbi:DUF4912 domain-containing protein, partial [Candidatus Poribacteria bacterium]|nr:DUF4912 domain-containing protein [Candidatus Poribacteria bacterium]